MLFLQNFRKALPTWFKTYGILFLLGLIARLVFFGGFDYTPWIYNDEPGYLLGARALLQGQTVVDPVGANFPTGFSFLLLPAVILTKNPVLQYQIGLLITSIISSLVAVVVYYFLNKQKVKHSFWIALLTGFHPSLFVYSGAVMSEVLYTLILIFFVYYLIKTKFEIKNILLISLSLFVLTIVRSAAIVVILAFYLSLFISVLFKKDKHLFLRVLGSLVILTILLLLDKYILKMQLGHYDGGNYLGRIVLLLENPGQAIFLLVNNSLVFVFMTFGLAFVWPEKTFAWIKKNVALALFLGFLVLGNILLTSVHSAEQFIGQGNNTYALCFRYLAPYAVLIYSLLLTVLFTQLKHIKLNYLLLGVFTVALFLFFRNTDWKFANNISVILLANRSVSKVALIMLGSTLFSIFFIFYSKHKLYLVVLYFLALSLFLSIPSLSGPRFAKNVYEKEMDLKNFTSDIPDRQLFLNRYLEK